MSLIIPANTLASGGYAVDNSCRFNSGSSDYLTRTSGTPTNAQKGTLSFWVKRSALGSTNRRFFTNNVTSLLFGYIDFTSGDKLRCAMDNAGTVGVQTNRLFRDTSAWYHIVVACDTTQGTSTDRVKLYVNGVQETSLETNTQPSLNDTLSLFNASSSNGQVVGAYYDGSSYRNYFDGYIAEAFLIDGTALDPTSFGEFDEDSGIWKPIDVSGLTFGTNGFYLDFENSSALGADVSGNTNNFTVNNLTATDQSTDTCTNNFATWNPLAKYLYMLTLSEGNTKAISAATNNPWYSARATIGFTSGKWFWETKFTGSTNPVPVYIGVVDESARMNIEAISENGTTMYYNGSNGEMRVDGTNTSNDYGNFSTSDICGIAINADDNLITIYKNGSAIVTNYALSTTRTGFLFPVIMATNTSDGNNSNGAITNFGSPPYSESGGETDGNGYGNFAHAVPSGFLSLCTANLSEVLG